MSQNGRIDDLTLHGGCPVIKGSKWITNKWIRHYNQVLNFPCKSGNDILDDERWKPLDNDICKLLPTTCKPKFGLGRYVKMAE